MEITVLSDQRLSSIMERQRAIDAEGFPLRLSADERLTSVNEFLPATIGDEKIGFECYHVDAKEMIETDDEIEFGRQWKHALVLVWGGDFTEMQATWIAAAAYARVTSGIVFDPQASKLFDASQALEVVQQNKLVLQLEAEASREGDN
jgi:hypothetical protein